jgi:hypothetical protein
MNMRKIFFLARSFFRASTLRVLNPILLIASLSACGIEPRPIHMMLKSEISNTQNNELITAQGTILWSDLEGGFYYILTNEEEILVPTNLSEELQYSGISLSFSALLSVDSYSIWNAGQLIQLESYVVK